MNSRPYSQWKATWAIARASLRALIKSPQSVFFSFFFPIVLIFIFGALSGGSGISVDVAFSPKTDTNNILYHQIQNSEMFSVATGTEKEINERVERGRITAIIDIQKVGNSAPANNYKIHLTTSSASQRDLPVLQSILRSLMSSDPSNAPADVVNKAPQITIDTVPGRTYRLIDFYLPGMLGFSLIGTAIFGVAFLFYNLRETLVLKRLYASPIRRGNIIIGETISRLIFQLINAVVLIGFGYFFYHFTLANGWITFFEMVFLSCIALVVFMGFGFVISSVARNQNVIPIYANLVMFPQYFLSGTFFSKNALPQSIHWLVNILPLTNLNDALRKISFEGVGMLECGKEIGILLAWGVVIYAIAIKVFRWD
jgi:ABC-2 type transport system permease protein